MTYRSIMVIIPPEMSDDDDCYGEVVEYVAACTGLNCMRDDLKVGDSVSCDAFFEDDNGNIWHGRLCYPSFPDGSQKYVIDLETRSPEQ